MKDLFFPIPFVIELNFIEEEVVGIFLKVELKDILIESCVNAEK